MNKNIILYLLATLLCIACSDDPFDGGNNINGDTPFEGGKVTLTLRLPDFTEGAMSRAMKDADIYKTSDDSYALHVLVFSGTQSDKTLMKKYANLNPTINNGAYEVTLDLPKGTTFIEAVANVADSALPENGDLSTTTANELTDTDGNSYHISWGYSTISKILSDPVIQLMRQRAKFTVTVDNSDSKDASLTDFTIVSATLVNGASAGTVAPAYSNLDGSQFLANAATIPTDATFTTDITFSGSSNSFEAYTYEASPDKNTRIIIQANNEYYPIDLFKDATSTSPEPVLRNHHYALTIKKKLMGGYSTLEAAKAAPVINHSEWVELSDYNAPIVNMIACTAFELGVSKDVTVAYNGTASISVFSSYKSDYKCDLSTSDSWIKIGDNQKTLTKSSTFSSTDKSEEIGVTTYSTPVGYLYSLNITLDKNDEQTESRTGTITVKSGDLTREIKITQEGKNFMFDDDRPIYINGLSGESGDVLYKTFLNDQLNGASSADMQGNARNNGLHFSFGNNSYTYKIKKLDGDKGVTTVSDKIDVSTETTKDGYTYYVVKLKVNNEQAIWKSAVTIENSLGIKIDYPVYHVGLFLKQDNTYSIGQPQTVKPWYYYEVVEVAGNNYNYFMLDRNLGATNNGYYAQSISELETNIGAIGGYYKITETKSSNLSTTLCPSGFSIPTEFMLKDIYNAGNLITEEKTSTNLHNTYDCPMMKTTGGSLLSEVYLPQSGYYEATTCKADTHSYVWTQTLLSGTQGFSSTTDSKSEYGWWFRYLDVYGKIIDFYNIRFVSGSSGESTDNYRYMPIRCMAKNSSVTKSYDYTIYYYKDSYTDVNHYLRVMSDNNYTAFGSEDVSTLASETYQSNGYTVYVIKKTNQTELPTKYLVTQNGTDTKLSGDNDVSITWEWNNGNEAYICATKNLGYKPIEGDRRKKIYFINTGKWDNIKAYIWKNSDKDFQGTDWPGSAEMTKCGKTLDNVYDIYCYFSGKDIEGYNVIFNNNNNGKQSAQYTIEDGKYYTLDLAIPSEMPTTTNTNMVYCQVPTSFNELHIYAWSGSNHYTGDWGSLASMTCVKTTSNYKVYSYDLGNNSPNNVIFNTTAGDDGTQSQDLSYKANGYYIWDGNGKGVAFCYTTISASTSTNAISRSASGTVKIGSAYWQQQAQKRKWYSIGK